MSYVPESLAARAVAVPVALLDTTAAAAAAMLARFHGLGGTVAERNAWDALCADRARRREWEESEGAWDLVD